MNEGQKVTGGFLVASRDSAVVFDAVHESFDEVAGLVSAVVESPLLKPVAARREDDLGVSFANEFDQFVRVVAFVGDHRLRMVLGQQFFGAGHVVLLAGPQTHFHRLTMCIYREMQLATESTARTSEGFRPSDQLF